MLGDIRKNNSMCIIKRFLENKKILENKVVPVE